MLSCDDVFVVGDVAARRRRCLLPVDGISGGVYCCRLLLVLLSLRLCVVCGSLFVVRWLLVGLRCCCLLVVLLLVDVVADCFFCGWWLIWIWFW